MKAVEDTLELFGCFKEIIRVIGMFHWFERYKIDVLVKR
jgi:hypothetical protein